MFQSIGQRSWRNQRSVSSLLIPFSSFLDPLSFVVVSVLNTRHQTPVAKRTLNPTYKDATFDIPIYLSLADKLGVVELVVWDKDMLSKEYLGEIALPLDDWFVDKQTGNQRSFGFDQPGNKVSLPRSFCSLNLFSFCSRSPSPLSPREWVLLLLVASRLSWVSLPRPILRIYSNSMKYSPSSLNTRDRPWFLLLR